jgi:hypothetical protein
MRWPVVIGIYGRREGRAEGLRRVRAHIGSGAAGLERRQAGEQPGEPRGARPELAADPMLLEGGRHTGGVVDVSSGGRSGIDERHAHMVSRGGCALHAQAGDGQPASASVGGTTSTGHGATCGSR